MTALGTVPGVAVLSRLPPTLGSLSRQVDDAQSLVTQISSMAKGKWPSSLTFVLQVLAYQRGRFLEGSSFRSPSHPHQGLT